MGKPEERVRRMSSRWKSSGLTKQLWMTAGGTARRLVEDGGTCVGSSGEGVERPEEESEATTEVSSARSMPDVKA